MFHFFAQLIVLLHGAFVIFALLGGLLIFRRKWIAWLHVPAVVWAILIEWRGWICPLTDLENRLMSWAGGTGHTQPFLVRLLEPYLYPENLTRKCQLFLGIGLLVLNAGIYIRAWIYWNRLNLPRKFFP